MSQRLQIVSVCRALPTPADPSAGIFVLNRLAAMSTLADVQIVQPLPYLAGAKPLPAWARTPSRVEAGMEIVHAPMFYLPGVLKSADAYWLARAVGPIIERLHRKRRVDLIDAHFGYPEGAGCGRVAEQLGLPFFVTVRGFENEYFSRPGIAGQMLAAMRSAAGCLTVSHSLFALLVRHGVNAHRIHVVHNAIDGAVFRPGDRAAARQRLGIQGPCIVSVGHLVSRKRHHVLIEAFARVRALLPEARLVIVGARAFEQQYPSSLERLAERLGVEDGVIFAGNVAPRHVVDWLLAADVFALATAREGCCNAVLEALAVGTPVVTTPAGDNPHFVRNADNGFIVPIEDVDAMAAAIHRALSDTAWDRIAIADSLHASVGTWSDVANRVLAFMDQRLRETAQPTAADGGSAQPLRSG